MKLLPRFDSETIESVIKNDFPDLKIESLVLHDNGWDNIVAEINDQLIFRFPKDFDKEEVEKKFNQEIKILNFLDSKISLKIPKIESAGKDLAYMVYKKIPRQ